MLAWQALVGVSRLVAPRHHSSAGRCQTRRDRAASDQLRAARHAADPVLGSLSFPTRLKVFIAILCIHQLFEHLGTVAVWAWLAELVPVRLRGRYFATRQRWQLAALIPASLAAAIFVDRWRGSTHAAGRSQEVLLDGSTEILAGYILVLTAGAVFLLLSIVPLWRMPAVDAASEKRPACEPILALRDARLIRLIFCGCWLSFANGISQVPPISIPSRSSD